MSYPFQIKTKDQYKLAYDHSIEDPSDFWARIAMSFQWYEPWHTVCNWNFEEPKIRWFDGAKLNITENCLDRHLDQHGEDVAMIFVPDDPQEASKKITYSELHLRVVEMAAAMRSCGVVKGDRVCIYMGMVPELAIAVLACARIGAIHSVVFGGFSAQSIADRIQDANAQYVVTCDGAYRGGKEIRLKEIMDQALQMCSIVKKAIVVKRTGSAIAMEEGRDVWMHDLIEKIRKTDFTTEAEIMEAEDPLFILYTSGSTGKPKGVVHSCAGYMVYATYTFVNVMQYTRGDIHFCTADIGWITGHSYILYGPLCAGATTVLFEGTPTYPDAGRLCDIIDEHNVNILYTAPTAIRSLMSYGTQHFAQKNLSSLKVLGTVGEPINEEAWYWYHRHFGKERCPIIDTWWQTETGGILISNLAGVTESKPTFATLPLPGIEPILVDEHGQEVVGNGVSGNLCIKRPWPSILRTTYGDHDRCRQNYFTTYPSLYFTGDGALRDEDGFYRITGRVDDVLNVSGHRIGTAELENAINTHTSVIESAVVGYPHEIKGQGIYAYVIFRDQTFEQEEIAAHARKEILQTVAKEIGPIAKPDVIQFVKGLPKTRSGKIMRRILRKIAEGETSNLGDTSTLLDPSVVEQIMQGARRNG